MCDSTAVMFFIFAISFTLGSQVLLWFINARKSGVSLSLQCNPLHWGLTTTTGISFNNYFGILVFNYFGILFFTTPLNFFAVFSIMMYLSKYLINTWISFYSFFGIFTSLMSLSNILSNTILLNYAMTGSWIKISSWMSTTYAAFQLHCRRKNVFYQWFFRFILFYFIYSP